jgi:hypothetical protein
MICSLTMHVGTGQRMAAQLAGIVVLVVVGHGTGVVVVVVVLCGGSVVTPMLTVGLLVVVVVVVVDDDDVVGWWWREKVVLVVLVVLGVVGHGKASVWTCMAQPPYGQSASHGEMRVAVGSVAGQPHGFTAVVTKLQLVYSHVFCAQRGLSICRVTVGHSTSLDDDHWQTAVSASASASASPFAAESFMVLYARQLILPTRLSGNLGSIADESVCIVSCLPGTVKGFDLVL